MVRRVITACLIAIALAGPGMCYCALEHVISPDNTIASHTCCHGPKDQRPVERPDTCPCRQHHEPQIVSLNNDSLSLNAGCGARPWLPLPDFATSLLGALVDAAADANHIAPQALDSPYPNSRAMLRALCVVRC